jgi:hypothetical protein
MQTIIDTREHFQNQIDLFQDNPYKILDTITFHEGGMESRMEATGR